MTFEWPASLLLLFIVPLLAAMYVLQQRRRRRYALKYASVSLVAQAVGNGPGIKRHVPPVLYMLALIAMIFGLARPHAVIPVPSNTGTVILTIDVSGSMLAEDVKPNRLEAAKTAVRDFISKQPKGVKIGIVAFSDNAFMVAPPSDDHQSVLNALARLRPIRGTNMGDGLQLSLDAIQQLGDTPLSTVTAGARSGPTPTPVPATNAPPATIVLLSDGQSNRGPNVLDVAQQAVAAKVKVYTIGIGTEKGAPVTIQGQTTITVLDESTLRAIADKTGGSYFNAQNSADLHQIYDSLSRERKLENREEEVTFVLAGVALILSMIAGGLGLLWFNRLP